MNQLVRPPLPVDTPDTLPALRFQRPLYRLTVEQYHRMSEGGVFDPDNRVELLDGILVRKMPPNPPHATSVRKTARQLHGVGPDQWIISVQQPITLKESEPEPDVSVVEGPDERYINRHPGPHDTLLVIEVGDSSLLADRRFKGALYAQAKIPIYWIINLVDEVIEVDTSPRGGKNPAYRECKTYGKDAMIPVSFAGQEFGQLAVKDLLP